MGEEVWHERYGFRNAEDDFYSAQATKRFARREKDA